MSSDDEDYDTLPWWKPKAERDAYCASRKRKRVDEAPDSESVVDPRMPSDCESDSESAPTVDPRMPSDCESDDDAKPSTLVTADGIRLNKPHSDGSLTPEFWETGVNKHGRTKYQSNVVHVNWIAHQKNWRASQKRAVGANKQLGCANVSKHGGDVGLAFEAACALRRGVKDEPSVVGTVVVLDDGAVVKTRCSRPECVCGTNVPIAAFAPDPRNSVCKFEAFALHAQIVGDARVSASERADALAWLHDPENTTTMCYRCRATEVKSHHESENSVYAACYKMAETIRADMRAKGCVRCGYNGVAMQCDHIHKLGKLEDQRGLLTAGYWVNHGGPKAMWDNYVDFCQPMCAFCHCLEPTHDINDGADSTAMPTETRKQKDAKRNRECKEENARINNGWKRDFGSCVHCKRAVEPGEEHGFHWMHKRAKMDATTKRLGLARPRLKQYTIGKLQNLTICSATFVKLAKPEIDECCELGCANCHHEHDTVPELAEQIGRLKAFVDEWKARDGIRVVSV